MEYELMPLTPEEGDYIGERIVQFVKLAAPVERETEEEEFILRVDDGNGNMIAGCDIELGSWGWARMLLSMLFVDERYRGMGLGSMLIREAERIAREKGCYIACLATLDYQARGLYEKHGYEVFTVYRDRPRGHEVYSMCKRLDSESKEYIPKNNAAQKLFRIRLGTDGDAKAISEGLKRHDDLFAPNLHETIRLNNKLADAYGSMIAGIAAGVDGWNGGYIADIFVEEPYRRRGLGSYLLGEFEREAKENGAYILLTSAGDWNVDFFKKHGFTEAGVLEDVPKGHRCYELVKML